MPTSPDAPDKADRPPLRAAARALAPVLAVAAALPPLLAPAEARAQAIDLAARRPTLEIDLLRARQIRNDARVPGDGGTRFDLSALTDSNAGTVRIEGSWPIGTRDELRVLVAPLSVDGRGRLPGATAFAGAAFAAGDAAADYRFDSYRLTWRRAFVATPELSVKLGLTAKIRSAEIELRQGGTVARKTDTGFVPLLHASIERRLAGHWSLAADIDALAASQGRAIDAGVRLRYAFDRDWSASLTWRVLDGGVDNRDTYNFARFQFVGASVRRAF